MKDVAEALSGDQPDLGARMGQDGIRCHRCSMHQLVYFTKMRSRLLAQRPQPQQNAARRVVRGGRDLLDDHSLRLVVGEVQVSERTTDIDTDSFHARQPFAVATTANSAEPEHGSPKPTM